MKYISSAVNHWWFWVKSQYKADKPKHEDEKTGTKKSFEVQCESICAVEDSRLQNFCSRQTKLKNAGRFNEVALPQGFSQIRYAIWTFTKTIVPKSKRNAQTTQDNHRRTFKMIQTKKA